MTVSSYRLLDRVRHHIAFGGRAGRLGVADLEDRLFRNRLETIAGRPTRLRRLAAAPSPGPHRDRPLERRRGRALELTAGQRGG